MSDQNDANPAVTDDIADPDTFTSFLDVRSDEDVQVSQSPNAASTTVIDTTSNAVESAGHAFTQPISSDASTIQPTRQPLVDEHHAEVANITTPIVTTNSAPSPQPIDHPLEQVLTPAEVVIPPTVLDPLSSPSASVPPQQFNLNEAESTGAPPHDITTTTTTANNNAAVNFNGNESNSSGDGSVVAFAQPKSPPVLLPPPSDVFSPSPPHSTTTTTTTMTTDMVVSDDSIGQQSDIISSETAKEELPSTLPSQPVVVQDDPIEHTQSNEPQYGSIEPLNKAPVIQPALPLSPKYNSHDSNTYDNNSHGSGASGFSDAPQYLQQQQPPPHLLLPSQLSAINPSPRSTILPPVDGRPLVTGDSGRGGFLSRSQLPPSSPSSPQSLGTSHALPPTLTAPGSPVSGGGTSRFSPMSPLSHSTRAPPPPPSSSSATTPTNPASTIPPYVARSPGSPLSTASPLLPAPQHLSPVKPVPPQLILGSPSSFPPGLLSPPPMIAQQSSSSSHRSNSQGVDSPRGSLPPLLLGAKDELSFPDKPPSDFQLSPGDLTLGRTMPPLQTNFPTHYGTPPGFPPSASMPSRKLKSKESKKDRRVMRKKSQSSSSSSSSASSSSASSSSSNMSQILGSTVGSSSPASPAFGPLPSSSSVLPSTPPASLPNLTDSVSGSYPPGPSPYSSSSPAGQQQVVVGSYPPYLHPQSAGSPSLSSSLAPSSPPSPSEYSSPASLPVPIQAPAYSREPSSPHSPPHGYPQQLSNTPYYSGHRTINFALLDDSALRRYKRHFKVRTKHNIPRTELLGTIQRHSASLSVEPRQIIDTFVTNTKAENKRRTRI